MREDNNRTRWIILTLVIVIALLVGIIAYYFWLNPAYQGFILSKQREAYTAGAMDSQKAILTGIKSSILQLGYVQITFEDNQTAYLAPFNPTQANQQVGASEIPLV